MIVSDLEGWYVKLPRLVDLELKEKELVKAKKLIQRLRAENKALKESKREQNAIYRKTYYETRDRIRRAALTLLGIRLGLNKEVDDCE